MFRSVRAAILKSSAVTVACCFVFAAAHADVYKYKDDKGNVLYTDKPMFLPAEKLKVIAESKNIVDLDQSKEGAENTAATANTPAAKPAPEKKPAQEPTQSKAEACSKARQDYAARMNARRLYEEEKNGERRYLTEKELDASRNAAKQVMDTFCN